MDEAQPWQQDQGWHQHQHQHRYAAVQQSGDCVLQACSLARSAAAVKGPSESMGKHVEETLPQLLLHAGTLDTDQTPAGSQMHTCLRSLIVSSSLSRAGTGTSRRPAASTGAAVGTLVPTETQHTMTPATMRSTSSMGTSSGLQRAAGSLTSRESSGARECIQASSQTTSTGMLAGKDRMVMHPASQGRQCSLGRTWMRWPASLRGSRLQTQQTCTTYEVRVACDTP